MYYRIKVERAISEITLEEIWIPVEANGLDEATDRAIYIAKTGIVPSKEWDLLDVRANINGAEFRRLEHKEASGPAQIPNPRQLRLFE